MGVLPFLYAPGTLSAELEKYIISQKKGLIVLKLYILLDFMAG